MMASISHRMVEHTRSDVTGCDVTGHEMLGLCPRNPSLHLVQEMNAFYALLKNEIKSCLAEALPSESDGASGQRPQCHSFMSQEIDLEIDRSMWRSLLGGGAVLPVGGSKKNFDAAYAEKYPEKGMARLPPCVPPPVPGSPNQHQRTLQKQHPLHPQGGMKR